MTQAPYDLSAYVSSVGHLHTRACVSGESITLQVPISQIEEVGAIIAQWALNGSKLNLSVILESQQ